jgi:hypothetical protein
MTITLNGTTGIITPDIDSLAAPDLVGTNFTSLPSGQLVGALPAIDGSSLTSLSSSNLTGNLPALNGSSLTSLSSSNLTGALPAIDGSALTGVGASTTAGAVGTYAWLGSNGVQTFSAGSSYAGSGLRYAGAGQYGWGFTGTAYSTTRGGTPAGTWRAMGSCGTGYSTVSPSTIFVRIS